ncbi:MAG: hypothetical protein KF723_03600 [Rhizobiaceae bacterium]|nr:hypothetical protein [Rhizobiaceae bacterium]
MRTMTQDEAVLRLYESLTAGKAGKPEAVRDMEPEAGRAYMRDAKARSRERQRQASEAGRTEPTAAAVRDALADAALMILAVDGPGAAQVRNALLLAFPGKTGLPMKVTQRARSGALKPKLLTSPATGLKSS